MLNKKRPFSSHAREAFQHFVLIIVALVVLLPVIEVVFAGLRINQAIFGPHTGILPTIDTNTWVDSKVVDRGESRISKKTVLNRYMMAFNGKTTEQIEEAEFLGGVKPDMYGDGALGDLKIATKQMVNKKGRKGTTDAFLEAYEKWEATIDEDLKKQVRSQIFLSGTSDQLRYKYDIRFSIWSYEDENGEKKPGNFKIFFTGYGVPDSPAAYFPMFWWFLNSIYVAGMVALIQLVVTALASYALSRFKFTGKKAGLMILLTVQVFPGTMAMVALYLLLIYLGKVNSFLGIDSRHGLILVYLGGGIPFNMWLVKGYFDTIPKSLEESAMIDGATSWQAFVRIILPLVRPILAVVTILSFIGMYNEFVLADVILNTADKLTLPVGLRGFIQSQGAMNSRFGIFAAASFIGSFPIVALWLSLQSQIISGLTGGSVKG